MPATKTKSLVEQIEDTRAATRRTVEELNNSATSSAEEAVARLSTDREAARRAIVGDEPGPKSEVVSPLRGRSASTRKSVINQTREQRIITKVLPMKHRRGLSYCQTIDLHQVETPIEWQKLGCPKKYEDAYELAEWKKRIWDEKSRLTKKARMMPKTEKAS